MKEGTRVQIFAAILLIVFVASPPSTAALTTFGKTNPQNHNNNPPPPPTPVGKARECQMESDCAGIQNTTCMSDPRDGRKRCLCGDYSAPVNGACNNKFKAIRAPCADDSECIEGAHCVLSNNTSSSGKRCYCREGFIEENLMCSGSSATFAFYTSALMFFSLFLGRLASSS